MVAGKGNDFNESLKIVRSDSHELLIRWIKDKSTK